jgi:hypothetical protein
MQIKVARRIRTKKITVFTPLELNGNQVAADKRRICTLRLTERPMQGWARSCSDTDHAGESCYVSIWGHCDHRAKLVASTEHSVSVVSKRLIRLPAAPSDSESQGMMTIVPHMKWIGLLIIMSWWQERIGNGMDASPF